MPRNMRPRAPARAPAIAIALMAWAMPAFAQDSAPRSPPAPDETSPVKTSPVEPAPVELAPVVASATRRAEDPLTVPAAVDVVRRAEIRRAQPAAHLSEALQRIPGVVARNRQNDAQDLQISIRGFGARSTFGVRGVRLYNDDIPATTPDGQGQVSHFALRAAARIEVLRGPFSALYGNAAGGVVKLYTDTAPPDPELQAGVVSGSDGYASQSLAWHAPWGADGAGDVLLDATRTRDGGYRRHSRSRRDAAQLLVRGDTGHGGRYTLLAGSLDLQAQDPQGLTAAQLQRDRRAASAGALAFDTRKTVRQHQAGAHLEQALGERQSLVLTAYATQRATRQMLSIPVFVQADPLQGGGALALDRHDAGLDARWQWTSPPGGADLTLTVGVDHEASDEHRLGFENFAGERIGVFGALRRDEDDRVASRDVYAQAEWAPSPRWRIDAGVRRSRVAFRSRDAYVTPDNPDDSGRLAFTHVSPVAGVLFRVRPWLSVYANAGEGFETPTFSELAYRDDGRSGLNTALRPALTREIEAGLRLRRGGLEASLAAFRGRTRDALVVVASEGGRSIYGNAASTDRRGVELSASTPIARRWHLAFAYAWLDARYGDACAASCAADPGRPAPARIPGLARQTAWSELRWSPDGDTDILLQGRFVDRVYADDANSAWAPAYASLDLGVERRFHAVGLDWRGFARVDNLLDRAIVGSVIVNDGNGRYFEPAPGRNWFVGLSAERRFR